MKQKKGFITQAGFTLVELMIVVGVISFLAVLITVFLRTQVFKGNDARKKADIKRIGIAVEEYEKDNNCYPLSTTVSCSPGDGLKPYLSKIPCDPVTKVSYLYEHEDSSCPKWYRIYGVLANESDKDYTPNIGPLSSFSYVYSSPNAPAVVAGTPQDGGEDIIIPITGYYGCFSGQCLPIGWNTTTNGPECEPYSGSSSCNGACLDSNLSPQNECN